uniref:Uncharacterized protein n=1 Tax=Dulem virus 38 TaxID=3145756 RepID=A0AAU8B2A4_9CAUD
MTRGGRWAGLRRTRRRAGGCSGSCSRVEVCVHTLLRAG